MTIATIEIRILFEMYFVYFLKDYSKSTVQISIYIKSCTEICRCSFINEEIKELD